MMALVGDPEAQVEWSERTLAIATASTDPHARRWISSIENNLGWTLHDLGRYEEAQEHFVRALAANEERGEPERIRIAHWTVARGLRSLGRYEQALVIQQRHVEQGPEDPYVYEELAELLMKELDAKGVGVILEATHTCMTIRGVRKPGAVCTTSAMRGGFRDNPATRSELMALIYGGR